MIETAIEAARTGAKILMDGLHDSNFRNHVERKAASDYVTDIDRKSQDAIVELILKRFPSHAIMAEESGGGIEGSEIRWIIDPLDGTSNYIHRFPVFAVSVAAERYDKEKPGFGEILAGAVINPLSNDLYCAEAGKGAFCKGERIHVSSRSDLSECILATGFPFRDREYLEDFLTIFRRIFNSVSGIRRAGSAAMDLCWTSQGVLDGFWEKGLSPWDMAAGCLLIKEAGGIISDFEGGNDYLESGNIITSTPEIHERFLQLLKG